MQQEAKIDVETLTARPDIFDLFEDRPALILDYYSATEVSQILEEMGEDEDTIAFTLVDLGLSRNL